ncbi:ComEC/Rec2 family competence protein [Sulfurovum sp. NBC37-1]|uniref:ComEC/Rec2 family competence protein n=1 Tax=Sulfurovum sp. (strain NBC37-1) TaxID=387093 RepID=UPI0001587B8E|nr:ComEC/Rec2 family competence protein [Sulfurovum sp. NBC37-1]BAF73072.1 DNA uptake protein [Sulfurovum sp. NBC37-1]
MEKPKLFETKKSFAWTMAFLLLLFTLRLGWEYTNYKEFISKPFYFTYATVMNAYTKQKGKRSYQVLKLHSDDGLTFYTITHQKKLLQNRRLRLQIFPSEQIGFTDYLESFYVKSRIRSNDPVSAGVKEYVLGKVASQHDDPALGAFYNAIFFATPISKEIREKISLLGVSHLVALSGFHLGILWALVYGGLLLLYRPLQQRYFPYRHALFDVGLVAIIVLGIYVWFVGAPPSLIRSYAMILAGWAVLLMAIELLSFDFLMTVAVLLLIFFPSLSVSLGFWLSVSGVFYIFLLLQYTKQYNRWIITLLVIPVGIFLLMLPIVHIVFGTTSFYQLLSPILSILFIPFYPLVMLLHLLGIGDIFDTALLWLFDLPIKGEEHLLPLWMGMVYIILSLVAIRYRSIFYVVLGSTLMYAGFLFLF